jgi:predicted CoA-binding protein
MAMATRADIDDFRRLQRSALVGVWRDPKDFSRGLLRELCHRGYDVVPINLHADVIDGLECFQGLPVVKPVLEGALLMTSPRETERVVRDCADAGIRRVWMCRAAGQGAVSEQAVEFCRNNDIRVVEGYCPYMFLPAAALPHRAHVFRMKLVGSYPAKPA